MANKPSTRVSNPPGGASNIFLSTPSDQPRKVRDHQKSAIFGADQPDSAKRNNFLSPRYQQDTKQRLFGEVDSDASPRRVTDTWRSNVPFSASADCLSEELKRTPRRSPSAGINPITGELLLSSPEEENGSSPYTNGMTNGHGTEENGLATHNGHSGHKGENGHGHNGNSAEKKAQGTRQPPGGKSSGIFG